MRISVMMLSLFLLPLFADYEVKVGADDRVTIMKDGNEIKNVPFSINKNDIRLIEVTIVFIKKRKEQIDRQYKEIKTKKEQIDKIDKEIQNRINLLKE